MNTIQSSAFVNGDVSHWIRAIGNPDPRPALPGDTHVDIAIVGGGLTGLWSAYYLKKAQPELNIAILERDFVGFGASGRNGGWLSAEPAGQYRRYAQDRGDVAARRLQHEMFGAVKESVEIARKEGFSEDLAYEGLIHVATNAAQMSRAQAKVDAMHEQGWGKDDVSLLSASELGERVNIDGAVGGYWSPHCARVHPAKFTLGLGRVVEALGVKIFESTTALAIKPHNVITDRGVVHAKHVVQALEGYTHSIEGNKRRLLPMNSSMAITEPLTQGQLDVIGWQAGELVGDVAHSFTYTQRTADNRIAIGGRGVPYNFASSFNAAGRTAEKTIQQLYERIVQLFPVLDNIQLDHSWTGVLGVPRDWSAAVNYDRETGVVKAGGYVGHGLAGTNLAARTVRDLILHQDTDLTRLPWVNRHARNWEIEPIRWIGATALYSVYRYADGREYASSLPKTHWTAKVANLISGRG
jgi:glycine/D-amino acid oxidase-like deaminating enzyme